MGTIPQAIHAWLTDNGPARFADIRAGLPNVRIGTFKQSLTRMRARGEVTRDYDGLWAAVPIADDQDQAAGLDPLAMLGALEAVRQQTPALAPLPWDAMLGPEVPGTGCAGGGCEYGCSSPPWRYTGDHTAVVCPECGPDCWDISPAAWRRVQDHEAHQRAKSARTGAASAALPQSALDRRALQLNRRRTAAVDAIAAQLARPEVRGDVRHDLEWLQAEYRAVRTGDRLDELDELRGELKLPRRPVGGTLRGYFTRDDAGGELVEIDLDDEDQADDGDQAPITAAPVIAGPVFTPALCGPCYDSGTRNQAAARLRSSMPAVVPERDVCLSHLNHFSRLASSTPGIEVQIVASYGPPRLATLGRRALGA